MIGLLQRVLRASVEVDDEVIGRIDHGLLVLIGVQRGDTRAEADRLLDRLLGYRVFADAEDRMNLSLRDIGAGLLLVPQFTLPADTRKGMRPSFTPAAPPQEGQALFDHLVGRARTLHPVVATGVFGAQMRVSLVNDGPVTFWLQTFPGRP
ncbi:MAG: D-tyrosyl-tRNA(Tyr) deacylase [Gammaproteobacteria bacterium]|nr:D-tyrosyl-tRNA(Tyr) deacylase [Gammaproteobacteria bacterium]MCG3144458.1 D-aminoacyl-tRNA deacylase [Gammaproteobacteria bacterium]